MCIGSFQADYNWDLYFDRFHGIDHTLSHSITAHYTAKNIDQNRLYIWVRENDLETVCHCFRIGNAAHIKKVCRFTALQVIG